MKQKFFGSKLPENVIKTSYPKQRGALSQGKYVDTQQEMDKEFGKAISKVKKCMYK